MVNPWFKFYGGEYLSDPKMDAFDGNERSVWITILCLASQTPDGWILYTTEEKLLEKAGILQKCRVWYEKILSKFHTFGMLEFCNGDVTQGFRPKNWEKRQYSEGYSRIRRFREKQSNETVTPKITIEKKRREEKRRDNTVRTSRTSPKKVKDSEDPLTREEFLEKMRASPQPHMRFLAEYADEKKLDFKTKGQWKEFINRNVKAASRVSKYSEEQITKAFEQMKKDLKNEKTDRGFITKWGIETIEKYLDK